MYHLVFLHFINEFFHHLVMWQIFKQACPFSLPFNCSFSLCFREEYSSPRLNFNKVSFLKVDLGGIGTQEKSQSRYHFYLALESVFLLTCQYGCVWCSGNLLQTKEWSHAVMIWLRWSWEAIQFHHPASCPALLCGIWKLGVGVWYFQTSPNIHPKPSFLKLSLQSTGRYVCHCVFWKVLWRGTLLKGAQLSNRR